MVPTASNDSGDQDKYTFEFLVESCSKAAEAGRICSADPTNDKTVEFLSRQVAQALEAPAADARPAEDANALVRKSFPGMLVNILRKHRCYADLQVFIPIFETLLAKGCDLPPRVRRAEGSGQPSTRLPVGCRPHWRGPGYEAEVHWQAYMGRLHRAPRPLPPRGRAAGDIGAAEDPLLLRRSWRTAVETLRTGCGRRWRKPSPCFPRGSPFGTASRSPWRTRAACGSLRRFGTLAEALAPAAAPAPEAIALAAEALASGSPLGCCSIFWTAAPGPRSAA